MDNLTEQDEMTIEIYKGMPTDDLFFTVEALHLIKHEMGLEELEQKIETTISIIREILIERNVVN